MIEVWSDLSRAGRLDRMGPRGSVFAYALEAARDRAVSMTMPVRLETYSEAHRLLPIFEMNLPEGVLREQLRLRFAKATGRFDDLDLLAVVGRSQIGRLRYTGVGAELHETAPFQSVDELLASRRSGDLYAHLLERFAASSGVSGVQPKVLIRDDQAARTLAGERPPSVRGSTHIVKFWDAAYPQLAANEYFCLSAARRAGLMTPGFALAEDGGALVVDRFDLRPEGSYRGFEDFAVLNARSTADKYHGSVETALFRRLRDFLSPSAYQQDALSLFSLMVINVAIRNGDAHLKNFGLVYDDPEGEARLAPAYDLVTTTAYLPQDAMALTFEGTTRWPDRARLIHFGLTRGLASSTDLERRVDGVLQALADTLPDIRRRAADDPAFAEVAGAMEQAWSAGMNSLKADPGTRRTARLAPV